MRFSPREEIGEEALQIYLNSIKPLSNFLVKVRAKTSSSDVINDLEERGVFD